MTKPARAKNSVRAPRTADSQVLFHQPYNQINTRCGPTKKQSHLYFQNSHATGVTRVWKPFQNSSGTCLVAPNQPTGEAGSVQSRCQTVNHPKPTPCNNMNQTYLANTQDTRMCWMSSSAWSQRTGSTVGENHTWLSDPRSNIYSWLNQRKNLQRSGDLT